MRLALVTLALLLAADARAQPGTVAPVPAPIPPPPAPPPPVPPAPPLEPSPTPFGLEALDGLTTPPDWVRVPDPLVVWRNSDGSFVSVARKRGDCLLVAPERDPRPGYFQFAITAFDRRALCLQLVDGIAVVTIGHLQGAIVTVETSGDVDELVDAIALRLRPPVDVPVAGGSLRTRLPITPIEDGFAVHGLPAPTRVHLRAVPGSCGTTPVVRDAPMAASLWGERWAETAVRGDRTHVYCLERRTDALEVTVDDVVLRPGVPPALDPELIAILGRLHDAVASGSEPPRLFGKQKGELILPRSDVILRDTQTTGAGWRLTSVPDIHWKLVDGDAWNEPGADVLLPTIAAGYAIVVRRGCTDGPGAWSGVAAEMYARDLGPPRASGAGATWRAEVCANGFTIAVRALDDRGAGLGHIRTITTAVARSVGAHVGGTQFRLEGLALAALPVVWSDANDTHWGLALRGRFHVEYGRPWSVVAMFELAFGGAGDNYHPGPEPEPDPDRDEVDIDLDAIGEIRLGVGGAGSLGPVTFEATIGAAASGYWPDASWLEAAAGASLHVGDDRIGLRYTRTLLDASQSIEVVVVVRGLAGLVRVLDFPTAEPDHTDAGEPRLGLELGFGQAF